jgi:UDP-N-acetylmuramate dehydrogenase
VSDFSQLTTMRVGGPARDLVEPSDAESLVETVRDAWASGEPWLILGGGSNLVVGDDGFEGTVIRVATRGVERLDGDGVRLRVQAGEPWDGLVASTVEQGLTGIEALSGIPGLVGAAPIQNIGAYGQELGDVLVAVEFLDFLTGEVTRIPAEQLQLGYRTSVIKQGRHGLVIAVELRLAEDPLGAPVAYSQLASALGVQLGDRVPAARVREAVLALRASKGMVLSDADPDSVSSGSFFTNPIVGAGFAGSLPLDAPRWPVDPAPADVVVPLDQYDGALPARQTTESQVKLSAAWLIEHSGISRGFSLPGSRAAVSSKHTLAIVNTGGATAAQVAELGRYIQTRVMGQFGVLLQPEPVLVGVQL